MKFPYKIIDLSHLLMATIPAWDTDCGFISKTILDYKDPHEGTSFKVQHLSLPAGIGTHIDAPAHVCRDGKSVDQLRLADGIVPCVVINVSGCAQDYQVSVADITSFEKRHGSIKAAICVFFYTGWSKYWSTPEAYRNNYQFPSIHPDVADYLISKKIVGIGIDTLGPDTLASGFPVHQKLLSAGIYIIENVAHLDQLPITGAFSCALPLNYAGGTESPLRLVAFVAY